jgi:hypothetical protein
MNRRKVLGVAGGVAAGWAAWELFMPRSGLGSPLWTAVSRRVHGVGTVSSGAVNRQIPQDEYIATCKRFQAEAATDLSMPHVVDGLWRTEGLSTTFGKYRLDDNTLNDPRLPREVLGITHVGYGAACTEFARFDTAKLIEISETKCHPDYKHQMLEGMGSILRIYEPGMFKKMCGMMGLIPSDAPDGPDQAGFFRSFMSAFPDEVQRLITHGYGRLVAFSKMLGVYTAIDEANQLPPERRAPCIQGIAFAFSMMNAADMGRMLERSSSLGAERVPFQTGLVYALTYCEWFAPGVLAKWKPEGKEEEKLVARAIEESSANLKRGHQLAFKLENPL